MKKTKIGIKAKNITEISHWQYIDIVYGKDASFLGTKIK
jgi:hypothetical protein